MDNSMINQYNGGLTREQFLFYEIRVVAREICRGQAKADILERIRRDNLFQFPTERMVTNIAGVCFKRLEALNGPQLVEELANGATEDAKLINLYAMMRYNRIVWDFMTTVIAEKFRTQNFELEPVDFNLFFLRLQEQNEVVALWSDGTIAKIKQVLRKSLVECGFLDSVKATQLNPVWPCEMLVEGIKNNGDYDALGAFNYFE